MTCEHRDTNGWPWLSTCLCHSCRRLHWWVTGIQVAFKWHETGMQLTCARSSSAWGLQVAYIWSKRVESMSYHSPWWGSGLHVERGGAGPNGAKLVSRIPSAV